MRDSDLVLLADHSVLLAIPAFVPAIIVAIVVVTMAMRDRRASDEDEDDSPTPDTEEHS